MIEFKLAAALVASLVHPLDENPGSEPAYGNHAAIIAVASETSQEDYNRIYEYKQEVRQYYLSLATGFTEEEMSRLIGMLLQLEAMTGERDARTDLSLQRYKQAFDTAKARQMIAERENGGETRASGSEHDDPFGTATETPSRADELWSYLLAEVGGKEENLNGTHYSRVSRIAKMYHPRALSALRRLDSENAARKAEQRAAAEANAALMRANLRELDRSEAQKALHRRLKQDSDILIPAIFGQRKLPPSIYRSDETFIYNGPLRMRYVLYSFGPCQETGEFKRVCKLDAKIDATNMMPHAFNAQLSSIARQFEIPGDMEFRWTGEGWEMR